MNSAFALINALQANPSLVAAFVLLNARTKLL